MLSDRKTICLIFLTAELALFICICDEVEEEGGRIRVGDDIVKKHSQVSRMLKKLLIKKIHEMYEKQRIKKE